VTEHNNQRKSMKRRAVVQTAVDHAAEATRLNRVLEIEKQDLRRQVEDLQAAAEARAEEHLCIIQQALEERGSTSTRISNSLYRRLKRHAPSVLEELPDSIKPQSGTEDFNDRPSKRPCLATTDHAQSQHQFSPIPAQAVSTVESVHQHQMMPPETTYHTQSQYQHGQIHAQGTSTAESVHQHQRTMMPPTTTHTHSNPSAAQMTTRTYQGHLPETQSFGVGEPPSLVFVQQYDPAQDSTFNALDLSNDQDTNDIMGLLDSLGADNAI
jgi:hypothetical protein